jgi:hypothetical protein
LGALGATAGGTPNRGNKKSPDDQRQRGLFYRCYRNPSGPGAFDDDGDPGVAHIASDEDWLWGQLAIRG